jgi:hypothetical protein
MKFSLLETKTQLQNYFHNNPKRIALAWIGVHIFFFVIAPAVIQSPSIDMRAHITSALFFITIFPTMVISMLAYLFRPISVFINHTPGLAILFFVLPILYYGLFIFMCIAAKDTQTKKFKIFHRLFTAWFTYNLVVSLYFVVLVLFYPAMLD